MTAIDAAVLLDVMSRFGDALEEHREELDSLNVFPVPDGDTGTNLALTQRAVREALEREPPRSLGDAGPAISRASLMGARGNSGVILAQFLRGFCDRLCANEAASAAAVAEALERGAEEARRAVATPVVETSRTWRWRRSKLPGRDRSALGRPFPSSARREWWTPAAGGWCCSSMPCGRS